MSSMYQLCVSFSKIGWLKISLISWFLLSSAALLRISASSDRLVDGLMDELQLSAERMQDCNTLGLVDACKSLSDNMTLVEQFLSAYSPQYPQLMFGNFGQWRLIADMKYELRVAGAVANGFSLVEVSAMLGDISDAELDSEIGGTRVYLVGFWIPMHLLIYLASCVVVCLRQAKEKK